MNLCFETLGNLSLENIRKRISAQALSDSAENIKLGTVNVSSGAARYHYGESLEEFNQKTLEEARKLGAKDDLITIEGLTPQMVLALAKDGVTTLDEFAKCSDWERAGGCTVIDGKRVNDLDPKDRDVAMRPPLSSASATLAMVMVSPFSSKDSSTTVRPAASMRSRSEVKSGLWSTESGTTVKAASSSFLFYTRE